MTIHSFFQLFKIGLFFVSCRAGKVLAEYKFSAVSQVTSVAFGGPNLDILFVTTASRGEHPLQAGHLYQITGLGSVGTAGVKVIV